VTKYRSIPRTPARRAVKAALTSIDVLAMSFYEGEAFHPRGL